MRVEHARVFRYFAQAMIDFTRIYYVIFALLAIVGGTMGYVKKRSVASLVAGGVSGMLLLWAAYLIHSKPTGAFILALVVSTLLAGRFIPTYVEKKTPIPAGLMSLLSLAGIVVTLLAWYSQK
jgi:uncharacterized membrane protein (UPF0136 family)